MKYTYNEEPCYIISEGKHTSLIMVNRELIKASNNEIHPVYPNSKGFCLLMAVILIALWYFGVKFIIWLFNNIGQFQESFFNAVN